MSGCCAPTLYLYDSMDSQPRPSAMRAPAVRKCFRRSIATMPRPTLELGTRKPTTRRHLRRKAPPLSCSLRSSSMEVQMLLCESGGRNHSQAPSEKKHP